MKKYLKILLVAGICGALIAFFFYKDINKEVRAITKKEEVITLFQVGVFKNYQNAQKVADTYPVSYIYKNEDYYRVIISLSSLKDNIIKLENIYQNKEINYYKKEIKVTKSFIEKIASYESILQKSYNEEVINNLESSMLSLFDTYILDK